MNINFERREMRKKILLIVLTISFLAVFSLLGGNKVLARRAVVESMDIREFISGDYVSKISEISSRLNVAKTSYGSCNTNGMANYLIGGVEVDGDGFVDKDGKEIDAELAKAAMLYNTWFLQSLMDCAYDLGNVIDENGSVKPGEEDEANRLMQNRLNSSFEIRLPAGTYYFAAGGAGAYGHYVIRQASGVKIIGNGGRAVEENPKADKNRLTILKPYSRPGDFEDKWNTGGLDMFHHNLLLDSCEFLDNNEIRCKILPEYAFNNVRIENCNGVRKDENSQYYESSGEASNCVREALYLENADYKSFIIDSAQARADDGGYNTSGKGFMLDAVRNSKWDDLVVRNTDGTCFAMDNPVNGVISNSKAEDCGKMATEGSHGASGFGIGTGYSTEGSLKISGSVSRNNTKFGYFFENQSRFEENSHNALEAKDEKAYQVVDSYADNNFYNFGGMRANDTYYSNNTSKAGDRTKLHIFFDDNSRRISLGETKFEEHPSHFSDLDTNAYYYNAVLWAERRGITNGVGENGERRSEQSERFGTGLSLLRQDGVVLLWRAEKRPGEVVGTKDENINIQTCFGDVPGNAYFAEAVKWGYDNEILLGTTPCSGGGAVDGWFSPGLNLSRAEFVTMVWRLAGKPRAAAGVKQFDDVAESEWYAEAVKWARSKKIVNGMSNNEFAPNSDCTREQAVTILYRYYNGK